MNFDSENIQKIFSHSEFKQTTDHSPMHFCRKMFHSNSETKGARSQESKIGIPMILQKRAKVFNKIK